MTFDELERLHELAFPDMRGWSATEFQALIGDPSTVFVALPDAFILGRVAVDEAEILTISTDPGQRRKGKAAQLLGEFENIARNRGAVAVFLEVGRSNRAARSLYENRGYLQVGERPGYYSAIGGSPVDALILRKILAKG